MKILLILCMLNLGICGAVRAQTSCLYMECKKKEAWEGQIKSKDINIWNKVKGFFKLIIKFEKDKSKIDREVWLFCVFRF